jgi:signal peptidase I
MNNSSSANIDKIPGSIEMYKVAGGSMRPFLRPGDILVIKKVAPEALCVGDVIAFHNSQQLGVVHRLIAKNKSADGVTMFQTRGDANSAPDFPVSYADIMGKVYFVEKAGYWHRMLNLDIWFRRKTNYLRAQFSFYRILFLWRCFKRSVKIILSFSPYFKQQ